MSVSKSNANADPQQNTAKRSSDGHILMHTLSADDSADFANMAGTKAPTLPSERRHNSSTLRDEAIV
jgi:hypothetical protein